MPLASRQKMWGGVVSQGLLMLILRRSRPELELTDVRTKPATGNDARRTRHGDAVVLQQAVEGNRGGGVV